MTRRAVPPRARAPRWPRRGAPPSRRLPRAASQLRADVEQARARLAADAGSSASDGGARPRSPGVMTTRSRTAIRRVLVRRGAWASLALALLLVGAARAGAQPAEAPATAAHEAAAPGHAGGRRPRTGTERPPRGEPRLVPVAPGQLRHPRRRLWYFLARHPQVPRRPRGQIRKGLADAAELKASAEAQRADVEARMKSLPGEIDALRIRAPGMAAEEARIRDAAEAERQRLVTRRGARSTCNCSGAARPHAVRADLAVGVATERVKAQITDEDQQRLADRYVAQVKTAHD